MGETALLVDLARLRDLDASPPTATGGKEVERRRTNTIHTGVGIRLGAQLEQPDARISCSSGTREPGRIVYGWIESGKERGGRGRGEPREAAVVLRNKMWTPAT